MNELKLENIDPSDIKLFSYKGETHDCVIAPEDIYDGDTIKIVIIRNNEAIKLSMRLIGIDTPELRPRLVKIPEFMTVEEKHDITQAQRQRELEVLHAKQARDALRAYIKSNTLQVDFMGSDKYGRELGILYIIDPVTNDRESINQWMINNDYAREYSGGKRDPWVFIDFSFTPNSSNSSNSSDSSELESEPLESEPRECRIARMPGK